MNRVACPLCHGEGFIEELIPGGYFDDSAACWYPLERLKACDLCKGSGSVEAPHHPNTLEKRAA